MVAGHTLLKFFFRQMLDQLREHGAARVHSALFSPCKTAWKSRFWPFSIEIVLASTMRYHADLQWVRMAFRDFSRTVVKNQHYDALVPGQLDFYFGASFLWYAGQNLPMLGGNLTIKNTKPDTTPSPLCGQPQLLL